MNSREYRNGLRFRSVVSAWREDSEGQEVTGYHAERVVCYEIDHYPEDTQRKRASETAKALMQAAYPQVNAFDIYNTVDEKESPAEVLGYVTGFGGNRQRYEANPLVAFRRPHNPAEHREAGAETWDQYFAMEADKRTVAGTPDDARVALAFAAEHDDSAGLGGI